MKDKRPTKKVNRLNGMKPFSLKLPGDYPWKVLSALTADLSPMLDPDEVSLLSQIIRDRDFAAYQILSDNWGLQSITPSAHVARQRATYQLGTLLKKFQFSTSKDDRVAMALEKFFKAEAACLNQNVSGINSLLCNGEKAADVLTYARSFVSKVLDGVEFASHDVITRWARHGPGSNLDTCKGLNNIYFKYSEWPYSCTQAALPYAIYLIDTDARWRGALENSYRERFNIPKHEILDQNSFWENIFKVVDGNRITFVPKDAQTERTIAIEPAMNLMLQLGVDGIIRTRLKRFGVDLDSQEKNQRFAFQGSLKPNGFVTIDLAAASDTISLATCKAILPDDLYGYLLKLRSPKGTLMGDTISYEKLSSMGNGFTFAIESLIFAALCYAAVMTDSGCCNPHEDFAVFGDDLVIQRNHFETLKDALSWAGFTLNSEKSFFEGPVRESCGTDWIRGKPIRPVFLKEMPNDVMDLFTDLNRLRRILELRFGISNSETEKLIIKWIPSRLKNLVGPCSDTEFSTYRHSPIVSGKYFLGPTSPRDTLPTQVWRFPTLIKGLNVYKGRRDFFFVKLMHSLRDGPEPANFKSAVSSGGGSRFVTYKSYSYVIRKTTSVASNWRSNYSEVAPV